MSIVRELTLPKKCLWKRACVPGSRMFGYSLTSLHLFLGRSRDYGVCTAVFFSSRFRRRIAGPVYSSRFSFKVKLISDPWPLRHGTDIPPLLPGCQTRTPTNCYCCSAVWFQTNVTPTAGYTLKLAWTIQSKLQIGEQLCRWANELREFWIATFS